ncbi:MAG: molybdopterin-containing oxidoreductase family protein [Thermodesulfobacteriota bacterium]
MSDSKDKDPHRSSFDRRTFLKLSALTSLAVGASQLTLPVDAPEATVRTRRILKAREEKWVVTSCLGCSGRCAIRVRVVNGRAVKITGNPRSLVSEGKICPRAHIGLQVLYDPERIGTPLKRRNREKGKDIDPQWIPISWNEALAEIARRLTTLRQAGQSHQLLLCCGLNARSTEDLIVRFAEAYGTPNLVSGNGLDQASQASGNWMADGHDEGHGYDLDRTQYLLLFGADLLESALPLSRFLRKWGKLRREKTNRAKVIMIHPRYSVTASKADQWIPIEPGTDGALAMGIAHVILSEDLCDRDFIDRWTTGFDAYRKLVLTQYPLEDISKKTGISSQTIQRIAREFAQTKPAIAMSGDAAINWPHGSFTSYAVFCLNALVGSIDAPGGILYQEHPSYKDLPSPVLDVVARKGRTQPFFDLRGTEKFIHAETVTNQIPESISSKTPYAVEMAIGFNCNFNMSAPGPKRWDEALKKIPYYVHLSPFISEMALYADLLLPLTTYLEEWGYDDPAPGSGFAEARIRQPVVQPYREAKSAGDILLSVAKRMEGSVGKAFDHLARDSEEWVKLRTSTLIPWEDFLKRGVWIGPDYRYRKYERIFNTPSKKFEFVSGNLRASLAKMGIQKRPDGDEYPHHQEAHFLGEKEKYPLLLHPYLPLMAFQNGSQNYPWAQEIFLPMHGIGWGTLVEINSETARLLKLKDGQFVWVESPFQKIKARVKFSEGLHPKVVSIPRGQGHYSYGKWQAGIGVNPNELIGVDFDPVSGQAAFFNTRVKVYPA